jgi:hypothetical protein
MAEKSSASEKQEIDEMNRTAEGALACPRAADFFAPAGKSPARSPPRKGNTPIERKSFESNLALRLP